MTDADDVPLVQLTGLRAQQTPHSVAALQTQRRLPDARVMSPTFRPGFREPCSVCLRELAGPVVVCSTCASCVHSHCSAAVMQQSICENCFRQWQSAEEARQVQHAAARSLGLLGARSSELLGTAVGAVGAAGAAASRFLVQGAVAGASSAWQASRLQEAPPRLEVQLPPRPAALPAPLPADPPADPRHSHRVGRCGRGCGGG